MNTLKNKVAIITGASSGIGRQTAILFAQEGASLIIGARRKEELKKLCKEIKFNGAEVKYLVGDVTDEQYNKELVDLAISTYGKLDIAFNNAGILGNLNEIESLSLEEWNKIINTNLTSAFLSSKYQIPKMKKNGGSIIFTSSFVGNTIGMPNTFAYAASKAGIVGLTKTLASQYGINKIRVNAILPGGTKTAMSSEMTQNDPQAIKYVEDLHALKRMALPEEIAKTVLYFASDASSFTTGTEMLVDGGVSIYK